MDAKGATKHGEWLDVIDACEVFPFKQRTAQRLMRVEQCDAFRREDVYAVLHGRPAVAGVVALWQ